jgi:nucleotide-binding universal stress UspA family protein
MLERLLVPLDLTQPADPALSVADWIPSRHVRLIHVEPAVSATTAGSVRDDLEAYGEEFAQQGRNVEIAIARGEPAEQIVAAAADVDLIVMSTRASGALQRALGGSIADQVARQAGSPTLIVRKGDQTAMPPARVVVPLDGSPLAERALQIATDLGRTIDVPIHLVLVVNRATILYPMEPLRAEAADYLDAQARRLAARGVSVTSEVVFGAIASSLLDVVRDDDLLVMATRGHGGFRRWLFGSVAERLLEELAVPAVLVAAGTARLGRDRGDARAHPAGASIDRWAA